MGRPLLDYWIELLNTESVVNKIFINTHYLPDPVREYAESCQLAHQIELIHEDQLLGTGGTLYSLIDRLAGEDVLVAHADNLTLFDISDFQARNQSRPPGCVGTMMTFETDNPQSCGIVELDCLGRVRSFHEKVACPPGQLANAAVFIFSPAALGIIGSLFRPGIMDISVDFIPHLLGRLFTFHNAIYHRDIGNPAALAAANNEFPDVYKAFVRIGGQ